MLSTFRVTVHTKHFPPSILTVWSFLRVPPPTRPLHVSILRRTLSLSLPVAVQAPAAELLCKNYELILMNKFTWSRILEKMMKWTWETKLH